MDYEKCWKELKIRLVNKVSENFESQTHTKKYYDGLRDGFKLCWWEMESIERPPVKKYTWMEILAMNPSPMKIKSEYSQKIFEYNKIHKVYGHWGSCTCNRKSEC